MDKVKQGRDLKTNQQKKILSLLKDSPAHNSNSNFNDFYSALFYYLDFKH